MKFVSYLLLGNLLLTYLVFSGCNGDQSDSTADAGNNSEGGDTDADSDTDTDADSDTDADGDTDTDTDADSDADTDADSDTDTDTDTDDDSDGGEQCPPLPPPAGNVVSVAPAQASELRTIIAQANTGDTISLADGTYNLSGDYLWIDTPGLTLRSESGNREAVIIDGSYQTTEIITVAASNVSIADLTLQRASTHPIHVTSSDSGDTLNTLIYNVHIIDPREQAIKINPHAAGVHFTDDGEVACSRIELTDEGRPNVNPTAGGCYTGGVDAHQSRGWVIRDNHIEGFWCVNGLSEHGIHLWRGCRDTIVKRNVLVDNARGIGFGLAQNGDARTFDDNPCPGAGYVGHYDGIIRNNFIFASRAELFSSNAGFDCGICLWSACGAKALHNSIASTGPNFSSIEWRFASSRDIEITNNLATHALQERNDASATQAGNLSNAPLSLFADDAGGDLHLGTAASDAVDQGVSIQGNDCTHDIDGDPRDSTPDIGADEVVD